jgi:hypothetical protein
VKPFVAGTANAEWTTEMTERARQQALLQALWQRDPSPLQQWLREPAAARTRRGFEAYAAAASAHAERALAGSFPTVQALIGEAAFAALARACWQAHPPLHGDLALFGAALPGFIAADPLDELPQLADVARLDWLRSQAETAADAALDPASLALLSEAEPDRLAFVPAPGLALLSSPHALVQNSTGHVLVWRRDWKAHAQAIDGASALWTDSLLKGQSIARALDAAGDSFSFEAWLTQALQQAWIVGVRAMPTLEDSP